MKLDLQQDAQTIRQYIEKRIRDYPHKEHLGPGEAGDPIELISLGYYLEQAGYFALVFDTRPEADNDGEWTLHIENEENVLAFPEWFAAFDGLCDGGSVEVTLPDGKTRTLGESDDNESVAALLARRSWRSCCRCAKRMPSPRCRWLPRRFSSLKSLTGIGGGLNTTNEKRWGD